MSIPATTLPTRPPTDVNLPRAVKAEGESRGRSAPERLGVVTEGGVLIRSIHFRAVHESLLRVAGGSLRRACGAFGLPRGGVLGVREIGLDCPAMSP